MTFFEVIYDYRIFKGVTITAWIAGIVIGGVLLISIIKDYLKWRSKEGRRKRKPRR